MTKLTKTNTPQNHPLHKREGFTIVELLIVIVVIGILAAISIVAYNGIQDRANDTNIKATAQDVGKALVAQRIDGITPSTHGYFGNVNGVDSTVSPSYLPSEYRSYLTSKNATNDNHIFRYYLCGSNAFVLYTALNNPSTEDLSNFTSTKTRCSHADTQAPVSGHVIYNYARVFEF